MNKNSQNPTEQMQADTAQAHQEPVAWRVRPFDYGIGYEGVDALTTRKEQCEMWERKGWKVEPLYAAPQPQAVDQQFNTWSHDDGDSWYDNPGDAEIIQSCLGRNAKVGDEYELWASIDAVTLRYRIVAQHGDDFEVECISQPQQKTAPPPPAAPQEPEAWMYEWNGRTHITTADQRPIEHAHPHFKKSKPLYTAPQPPAQSCCTCTKTADLHKAHEPAPQQKPVAWLVCSTNPDGSLKVEHAATWKEAAHEHINDAIVEYEVSEAGSWIVQPAYTAPQPTENLRCKSTQKRLATLWGYVKKEPDHFRDATQIVSVSQMLEVLRTKYSDLIYESNQKMAVHFEEDIFTINDFLQRIQQEAAEKARQPLTDEKILSIVRVAPALDTAEAEWLHFARAVEAAHGIGSTHG